MPLDRPASIEDLATRHRRWYLVAAVVCVACLIAGFLLPRRAGELTLYLKTVDRLVAGEAIYRTDDGAAFTYPPGFALPFLPLAAIPRGWATPLWMAINLALMSAVLVRTLRIVAETTPGDRPRTRLEWIAGAVLFALLAERFVMSPLEYRSHDVILLLLIVAAVRCGRSAWDETASGALLGIAAACKATPLLFLPVLLLSRRWRAAGAFLFAMSLWTLLPDLLYPQRNGRLWAADWYSVFVSKVSPGSAPAADAAWAAWNIDNQSLSGTIHRWLHAAPPQIVDVYNVQWWNDETGRWTRVVTLAIQATVFLSVCLLAYRTGQLPFYEARNRRSQALATAAVLSAMLLLSPMTSKYHFCAIVVPLSLWLNDAVVRRRPWLSGLGLALLFTLGFFFQRGLVGRRWGTTALAYGSLTACAAVVFFAACWLWASHLRATRRPALTWSQRAAKPTTRAQRRLARLRAKPRVSA